MKRGEKQKQNKTKTKQANPFFNMGGGYQVAPYGIMLESGHSRMLDSLSLTLKCLLGQTPTGRCEPAFSLALSQSLPPDSHVGLPASVVPIS